MIDPKNFCVAPFSTMVTDYMDRTGPCPYTAGLWHLKNQNIAEKWKSSEFDQLREKHLSGSKPEECNRCYTEEKSGQESLRISLNRLQKNTESLMKNHSYKSGPTRVVFRVSNICNLACRTCHAIDTSKYHVEGVYYQKTYGAKNNIYLNTDERKNLDPKEMIAIKEISDRLNSIEFYGGEPLLNKTHHVLLDELISSKKANDIGLHYCTNGITYPSSDLIEKWKSFRSLRIGFSIDGIKESFHYLRWPASWKVLVDNINQAKSELSKQLHPTQFSIGVNLTVGIHNIYDLPKIHEWLSANVTPDISYSLVHNPEWYSIKNIPPKLKEIISTKLSHSKYDGKFDFLINHMANETFCELNWEKFIVWTIRKDKFRNMEFKKTFPEYWEHLSPFFISKSISAN